MARRTAGSHPSLPADPRRNLIRRHEPFEGDVLAGIAWVWIAEQAALAVL